MPGCFPSAPRRGRRACVAVDPAGEPALAAPPSEGGVALAAGTVVVALGLPCGEEDRRARLPRGCRAGTRRSVPHSMANRDWVGTGFSSRRRRLRRPSPARPHWGPICPLLGLIGSEVPREWVLCYPMRYESRHTTFFRSRRPPPAGGGTCRCGCIRVRMPPHRRASGRESFCGLHSCAPGLLGCRGCDRRPQGAGGA